MSHDKLFTVIHKAKFFLRLRYLALFKCVQVRAVVWYERDVKLDGNVNLGKERSDLPYELNRQKGNICFQLCCSKRRSFKMFWHKRLYFRMVFGLIELMSFLSWHHDVIFNSGLTKNLPDYRLPCIVILYFQIFGY